MKTAFLHLLASMFILATSGLSASAQTSVVAWGGDGFGESTVPGNLAEVVAIAVGGYHSLALKTDGTVKAWGDNQKGQCFVPAGLSGVVSVAAGGGHSLALKTDGTVSAWGDNQWGQCTVPAGLSGVMSVTAGGRHSLALKTDGTVMAWGDNPWGQCSVPAGLSGVVSVAAGGGHSLALKTDGTVTAWGDNQHGQQTVPAGLSGVTAIAAGLHHSLALKANGTVAAWGNNFFNQSTVPPGLTGVVAISAGGQSLALRADGTIAAWGSEFPGQNTGGITGAAGIATYNAHSLALLGGSGTPVVTSARRWITEAAGARAGTVFFRQRILATGTPVTYGATGLPPGLSLNPATGEITGASTQTGSFPVTVSATNAAGTGTASVVLTVMGLPYFTIPPPEVVSGPLVQLHAVGTIFSATGLPPGAAITPTTGLVTGLTPGYHTITLTVSNSYGSKSLIWPLRVSPVHGWGANNSGQITPADLSGVVAVAAGWSHSLALRGDGTVAAWGYNYYGQCTVPAGLTDVVAIAGGQYVSLALKSDGSLVGWGSYTQLPGGLTGAVAIAAGRYHWLVIQPGGTVTARGLNTEGQSAVPADLAGVTAIAAGDYHSLALKSDGTVAGWGSNSAGESTVPAGLSSVIAIAAGSGHSLALKGNGTVEAWGDNRYGQSTVPPGLAGIVAIAAGRYHSLALKADGTVVAWGSNFTGESTVPAWLSRVKAIAGGLGHSLALIRSAAAAPVTGAAGQPLSMTFPPAVAVPQFSATGLPPGLTIHPTTGVISGIPAAAGSWTATIMMSNRAQTRFESQAFTIVNAQTAYTAWLAATWPAGGADSAPDEDPDKDGATNLVEYATGTNALTASPTTLPVLSRDAGERLVLTLDVPAARLVPWEAQFADDLTFSDRFTALPETVVGAPAGKVRLQFTDPQSGRPRRLARLRAAVP